MYTFVTRHCSWGGRAVTRKRETENTARTSGAATLHFREDTGGLLPVPVVEGALQQDDGREAVADLFSLFAPDARRDQVALRLGGRHSLVPGLDRYPQAFRDLFPELPCLFRLGPFLATQVQGQSDQHGANGVFPDQGPDRLDVPAISLPPDGDKGLGGDPERVGDGRSDPVAPVVQPENPPLRSLLHAIILRKKCTFAARLASTRLTNPAYSGRNIQIVEGGWEDRSPTCPGSF